MKFTSLFAIGYHSLSLCHERSGFRNAECEKCGLCYFREIQKHYSKFALLFADMLTNMKVCVKCMMFVDFIKSCLRW